MSRFILRLTGSQHAQLKNHLFPGDENEAVALALCGRLQQLDGHTLCSIKSYSSSTQSAGGSLTG